MLTFTLIVSIIFLFAALICYVSCYAAGRADRIDEEYWRKKYRKRILKI